MSKLNDIIKLCVGGKEFKTTRATLIADQNSMLAKMFEDYDERYHSFKTSEKFYDY